MSIRSWIDGLISYALAAVTLTVDKAVTAVLPKQFDESAAQRFLDDIIAAADMHADCEETYEPLEHTDIARTTADLLDQAATKLQYWSDIWADMEVVLAKNSDETTRLVDELRTAAHQFTATYT